MIEFPELSKVFDDRTWLTELPIMLFNIPEHDSSNLTTDRAFKK